MPSEWTSAWDRLPAGLRDLYAVHDGWYLIPSRSGGHFPLAEWTRLSDKTWQLEQRLMARMPIDPARTVVVYAQGGSGYLGFELPASEEEGEAIPLELGRATCRTRGRT